MKCLNRNVILSNSLFLISYFLFLIFHFSGPIISPSSRQPAEPDPDPVLPGPSIQEGLNKVDTQLFENIIKTYKQFIVILAAVDIKSIAPCHEVEI